MRLNLDKEYERRGVKYGPGVVEIMDLHEAKQIAAVMRSEGLDHFAPVAIHEEIAAAGKVVVVEPSGAEPAEAVTPLLAPVAVQRKSEAARGKPEKAKAGG